MSDTTEPKKFLGEPQETPDGTPWTEHDLSILWSLASRGMTSPKMQFYLLRTPSAIRSKLHRMREKDNQWIFAKEKETEPE
ncbi:hypothetical protein [Weissella cibaria]|uniref:hypothetical protein n=1 Tax=Weissella cibaria TaxID=137591 RepID=UPI0022E90A81|nr:hypothetical protein [Weissella cibaria]